jgi:hypothetical protein
MFKISYDEKHDCLVGVYQGMLTDEIFTACAEKISSVLSENECRRFALDLRQAELIVTKIDIAKFYFTLFQAGLDESWKKAVVFSLQDYKQIEETANLKEYPDMSLFGNGSKALEWLNSSPGS